MSLYDKWVTVISVWSISLAILIKLEHTQFFIGFCIISILCILLFLFLNSLIKRKKV